MREPQDSLPAGTADAVSVPMARPVRFHRLLACAPLLEGLGSPTRVTAEIALVVLAFMGPLALGHLPPSLPEWAPAILRLVLAAVVLGLGLTLARPLWAGAGKVRRGLYAAAVVFCVLWPIAMDVWMDVQSARAFRAAAEQVLGPAAEWAAYPEGSPATQAALQAGWTAAQAVLVNTRLPYTAVHGLAVVALALLVVSANGQGLAQLGLSARGIGRDLLWTLPTVLAIYIGLVASIVPIALVYLLGHTGALQDEVASRMNLVHNVLPVMSPLHVAGLMVLVAVYEEIVFRGFLIPRFRRLTGSWTLAVALPIILFGLGHAYQGNYAVFQTSAVGLVLAGAFLLRGRLLTAILAHAIFNSVQFGLMDYARQRGWFEQAQQIITQGT